MVFRLRLRQVLLLLLLLPLLLLGCRSSRSKDLELLVLRQEIDVMRRQVPHPGSGPKNGWSSRCLGGSGPAKDRFSSLVLPRRRVASIANWSVPNGDSPTGSTRNRIPEEVQLLVWRLATQEPVAGRPFGRRLDVAELAGGSVEPGSGGSYGGPSVVLLLVDRLIGD